MVGRIETHLYDYHKTNQNIKPQFALLKDELTQRRIEKFRIVVGLWIK